MERSNIMEEKLDSVDGGMMLISSHEDLDDFESAVEEAKLIAFDAEGVSLSRTGPPTLATFGIQEGGKIQEFLFDLLDSTPVYWARQLSILKRVLEDVSVIKIIHDCRQDSDSFNEFFKIRLAGVFDTSVFYKMIQNEVSRASLNSVLDTFALTTNSKRKSRDFYGANPEYWAERPLTKDHLVCASGDVVSLFVLREKMIAQYPEIYNSEVFKQETEEASDEFRSLRWVQTVVVSQSSMGSVIGTRGCVIAEIERTSGAKVSKNSASSFIVMAKDQRMMDKAVHFINKKANRIRKNYNNDY